MSSQIKDKIIDIIRSDFDQTPKNWEGAGWYDNAEEAADSIIALFPAPAPVDAVRLTAEDCPLLDKALTASTTPAYSIDPPAPAPVEVKKLDWEISGRSYGGGEDGRPSAWGADTGLDRRYSIFSRDDAFWVCGLGYYPTIEAAKAAAQADYTARILSALDASALAAAAEREAAREKELKEAEAEAEHWARLACDDLGKNPPVFWKERALAAEARVTAAEAERDAEQERCAQIVDEWSNPQAMKLHAGEMTAGEVRTSKAILTGLATAIRKETTNC